MSSQKGEWPDLLDPTDEQELSVEEFNSRRQVALSDEEEMTRLAEVIRRFMTDYPSAGERLAHMRREYTKMMQSRTGAGR